MRTYFQDKLKFLTVASADSVKLRSQIQTYLNKLLPNRLQSKLNIFNTTLDVVEDQTNVMYGYLADAMRENNVLAAQHEVSVRGLAEMTGHSAVRPISARGVVNIRQKTSGLQAYGSFVLLTEKLQLHCKTNGLNYMIDSSEPISMQTANQSVSIPVIEGVSKTQQFVVDSSRYFTVHLDDKDIIEHYSVRVKVNSVPYNRIDNIMSASLGAKIYVSKNGFYNQVDILFGNDTHGLKVNEGDIVTIDYMTTNGSYGNLDESAEFEIMSGVTDSSGSEIEINDLVSITYESGFMLGSDGEHIEVTRSMCGFSDRSLAFNGPDSIKEYLSRITSLSHIDAWTEANDRIFKILALPKLVFKQASDYLYIDENKFMLSDVMKTELTNMIVASRRQIVGDEFVFVNPVIRKYAMFIYLVGTVTDAKSLKSKIENAIASYIMSKTYGDVDLSQDNDLISKSYITDLLYELPEIDRVSVTIYSELNELAKINGKYIKTTQSTSGAIASTIETEVIVSDGDEPLIGLSEIDDILTQKNEIPVIRGGFDLYHPSDNIKTSDSGINIFYKDGTTWTELV